MSAPRKSSSPNTPDLQWRAQELLLMREVMRLIGKSQSPDVVMREMLHLMSELLGLNRGRIVLADADGSHPPPRRGRREAAGANARIRYSYGMSREEVARGFYSPGEGITGRVLATGQPILVQDIHSEDRFLGRSVRREHLQQDGATFIALPIEVHQQTVGVLACHRMRNRRRRFHDDVALLKILAALAGQTLQLHALLQEKTRELEDRNALLNRALNAAAVRYSVVGNAPALLHTLGDLGNAVERLVLLTDSTLVSAAEIERRMLHSGTALEPAQFADALLEFAPALPPLVREYSKAQSHSAEALRAALQQHHGNQSRAAQSLGLTARQFSYRLQKAGLR